MGNSLESDQGRAQRPVSTLLKSSTQALKMDYVIP